MSAEEGAALLKEALASGAGLEKFRQMIRAQGGNPAVCDDLSLLPQANVRKDLLAAENGYVRSMDTTALGMAAQAMGAGRIRKTDVLDYSVGYILTARVGDRIEKGQKIGTIFARNEAEAGKAEKDILSAITLSRTEVRRSPMCYAVVTRNGTEMLR